jgi:nitroreductase
MLVEMMLDQFEIMVRSRRATRHFLPDPIPDGLLERLIDLARWAPSGYNLQPTHMVIVDDARLKPDLHRACLEQSQVLEAPATVVFTGDRLVAEKSFEKILAMDLDAGATTLEYAEKLKTIVPLSFGQGPLGFGWLWKALLLPLVRMVRPVPSMPAVEKRYWLSKQVMLTAMNFMLGATAAGLATVPMEGFDEGRVRKVLKIPSSHIIPVIIPVGYSARGDLKKTRLPLQDIIHHNEW